MNKHINIKISTVNYCLNILPDITPYESATISEILASINIIDGYGEIFFIDRYHIVSRHFRVSHIEDIKKEEIEVIPEQSWLQRLFN